MSPSPPSPKQQSSQKGTFQKKVSIKVRRKLKARRQKKRVWFGVGMFGVVGWSVSVPTLLGLALGLWLDKTLPSRYSWTLMMLTLGLGLGCFNAWYWIKKESSNDEG